METPKEVEELWMLVVASIDPRSHTKPSLLRHLPGDRLKHLHQTALMAAPPSTVRRHPDYEDTPTQLTHHISSHSPLHLAADW
jgi:hypothetical protein